MGDISENFNRREFACKCKCGFDKIDPRVVACLELIRGHIGGKPITVNRACRCPKHNKAVGGEPNSNHLRGHAADIKVSGVSALTLHNAILNMFAAGRLPMLAGLGQYDTFVHVDVEPKGARLRRWDERAKK